MAEAKQIISGLINPFLFTFMKSKTKWFQGLVKGTLSFISTDFSYFLALAGTRNKGRMLSSFQSD